MTRAARLALRYYFALRVSAAAATPAVFSLEHYEPPAPIVRAQPAAMIGAWDERELVSRNAVRYIITTTLDVASSNRSAAISNN
jgi:hypothetical protein